MIFKVAYDDNSETFFKELKENLKDFALIERVEGYHEQIMKQQKKVRKLKGSYGAHKSPFAALETDDKVPVKAFYTEANQCTVDNIINTLKSIFPCK